MLLQLKTSELGGGKIRPPPQVQRVFKSPGKIGLKPDLHVSDRMLEICQVICLFFTFYQIITICVFFYFLDKAIGRSETVWKREREEHRRK